MRKMLAVLLLFVVTACSGGASADVTAPHPSAPRPVPPAPYVPVAPFALVAQYDSAPVHFNTNYDLTAHVQLVVKDANDSTVERSIPFQGYVGWGGTNNVCTNTFQMQGVGPLSNAFFYSLTALTCNNATSMALHIYLVPMSNSISENPITWSNNANAYTSPSTQQVELGTNEVILQLVP
jgi:hypothetical protein